MGRMSSLVCISKVSLLSKALSLILIAIYTTTLFYPNAKEALALIPGRTVYRFWTLVTSSFVPTDLVELAFDVFIVVFVGINIEPMQTSLGLFRLLLFVSALTGFLTFATIYITYICTFNENLIFKKIYGFHGIYGALLVAVKQIMADKEISLLRIFNFKIKWLPSIYALVILCFGFYLDPLSVYPFAFYGIYTGWFYLRFIIFMSPPLDFTALMLSRLFRLRAGGREDSDSAYLSSHPLGPTDSAESARRKEKGKRALEERLNRETSEISV